MPPDNHTHLAAAAARRSAVTLQAATDTLRRLDAAGTPITFALVASEAGVSRSWLYRHPQIRAEIARLRTTGQKPDSAPAAQRASDTSLHQRIEALLDDNGSPSVKKTSSFGTRSPPCSVANVLTTPAPVPTRTSGHETDHRHTVGYMSSTQIPTSAANAASGSR